MPCGSLWALADYKHILSPQSAALSTVVMTIYDDLEALSRAAAALFADQAQKAVADHGRFAAALAGGHTPLRTYQLLAQPSLCQAVPWTKTHIFWGDERCVPSDDPGSNERMVRQALLDRVPMPAAQVHPIHCQGDARQAALDYQRILEQFFGSGPPRFDLILLGLGADGHTASLFPGSPVLHEQQRWVAEVFLPQHDLSRVTLTPPLINQAALVVFLVAGVSKAAVLQQLFAAAGDPAAPISFPAQLIRPARGELRWLVDKAAAPDLPAASLPVAAEDKTKNDIWPTLSRVKLPAVSPESPLAPTPAPAPPDDSVIAAAFRKDLLRLALPVRSWRDAFNLLVLLLLVIALPFLGCCCCIRYILLGYLCAYALNVVAGAAAGEDNLPELGSLKDALYSLWSDVFMPLADFLGSLFLALLPAGFLSLLFLGLEKLFPLSPQVRNALTVAAAVAGAFFWPILMLIFALEKYTIVLHPLWIIKSIQGILRPYVIAWLALLAAGALLYFSFFLYDYFFPPDPSSALQSIGAAALSILDTLVFLYAMRVVGLLCRHYRHRLPWAST